MFLMIDSLKCNSSMHLYVIISDIAYSWGFLVLQLSPTTNGIVLFEVILCNKVECIWSDI